MCNSETTVKYAEIFLHAFDVIKKKMFKKKIMKLSARDYAFKTVPLTCLN